MSKIKEFYLNNLTEEEMNQIPHQGMVDDGEYKDYFIKRLRTLIIELKMSDKDKLKSLLKKK